MSFHVETTPRFYKQLKKLDKFAAKTILKWLAKNIEGTNNPRLTGRRFNTDYIVKYINL